MPRFSAAKYLSVCLSCAIVLSACSSIGPQTVSRDRFDYVIAISESIKRQTLLNMVKTRYMDAPVYMDIASVISQYAIEGELGFELTPSLSDNNLLLGNGKYADRPTITYSPLSGKEFSRSLLKPLPLSSIILLLQSGYPVDAILHICVQSINGVENRRSGVFAAKQEDRHFAELLATMHELQMNGSLYFKQDLGDRKVAIKMGLKPTSDIAILQKERQLRELIGLDPRKAEFQIVFGIHTSNDDVIAVLSRSMMQIMIEYAADISVPQMDIAEGRVVPTVTGSENDSTEYQPLIRVNHGQDKPDDAFVSVYYRDNWYWISDTDIFSKSSFNFLMTLFSLTQRGQDKADAPIVTVPTY